VNALIQGPRTCLPEWTHRPAATQTRGGIRLAGRFEQVPEKWFRTPCFR